MNIEEILLCRNIRFNIVLINDLVYRKKWDTNCWKLLEIELDKIIKHDSNYYKTLVLCKECANKNNYLRLGDLLIYEIDWYIMNKLMNATYKERINYANFFYKKNEEQLKINHKKIYNVLQKMRGTSRLEIVYEGAENVSISIVEKNNKFKLYSIYNPWLESYSFINNNYKVDEICVLGFGGGYLIGELQKKYCDIKMKVYLPNIDIFRAVIFNLPVSDILNNKNIELLYDPICMKFFSDIRHKIDTNKNIEYYIDKQELRACVGNDEIAEQLIIKYQKKKQENYTIQGQNGVRIMEYVKGI